MPSKGIVSFNLGEGEKLLGLLLNELQAGNLSTYGPLFTTLYWQMRGQGEARGTKFAPYKVRPYIILWLQQLFEEFQTHKTNRYLNLDDQQTQRLYVALRKHMNEFAINWADLGVGEQDATEIMGWRRRILERILTKYGVEVLIDQSAVMDHSDFPDLFAGASVTMV